MSSSPILSAALSSPRPGVPPDLDYSTTTLLDLIARVKDPRAKRGVRHTCHAILVVTLIALFAGHDTYVAIAAKASRLPQGILDSLGIRGKTPGESTIRRLVGRLAPGALDLLFGAWVSARLCAQTGWTVVAVDGKTLRGSRHGDVPGVHMLTMTTHAPTAVIASAEVDAKTNEIPALRDLLDTFTTLEGLVITADALHTHTATAQAIIAAGGHYALTVKGNQPRLLTACEALPWKHITAEQAQDRSHGRRVTRLIRACEPTGALKLAFPHVKQVIQLTRLRYTGPKKKQKKTTETVYVICSVSMLQAQPHLVASWIRGHWAVESLHWLRDATFGEDAHTARTGNAPLVMAMLRNLVITVLHLNAVHRIKDELRRLNDLPHHAFALLTTP